VGNFLASWETLIGFWRTTLLHWISLVGWLIIFKVTEPGQPLVQSKGKFIPVHIMKACGRSRRTASLISNLFKGVFTDHKLKTTSYWKSQTCVKSLFLPLHVIHAHIGLSYVVHKLQRWLKQKYHNEENYDILMRGASKVAEWRMWYLLIQLENFQNKPWTLFSQHHRIYSTCTLLPVPETWCDEMWFTQQRCLFDCPLPSR
jgi:hypothetical protein